MIIALLGIVLLVILLLPLYRGSKFKEIERLQTMRRAMMVLQEKYPARDCELITDSFFITEFTDPIIAQIFY